METDPSGPLKELLADRYRIDRELGRGGFATVYQVWNPRLERSEALKVLAPGHQVDEDFSRRFTQEVRLAAALEHPSIVKVYDFGETGGIYWYSMQLVEGRTLSGEVRERGPLRERETARIAIPLLEALEYSHARGIVHRDIKPENIILDREGRPFLMDFGIAKSAGSLVKTQTGFLLGTPAYVAPEQAQGKKLDGRADLYALGVTLYKTVSGAYPFEASDPLQAVILRLTQPPRPLAEARPGDRPGLRRDRHARSRARAGGALGFCPRDAGRAGRVPRRPPRRDRGDTRPRSRGPRGGRGAGSGVPPARRHRSRPGHPSPPPPSVPAAARTVALRPACAVAPLERPPAGRGGRPPPVRPRGIGARLHPEHPEDRGGAVRAPARSPFGGAAAGARADRPPAGADPGDGPDGGSGIRSHGRSRADGDDASRRSAPRGLPIRRPPRRAGP